MYWESATEANEFGSGLGQSGVSQLLALGQRGGEASAGQGEFAEPGVGDAAEVQRVGLAPGVLALRVDRAVERLAGTLERRLRLAASSWAWARARRNSIA